ncbi:MAG: adenylate/guanylate cyclase domain-containing protein [Chloroflexi bacterium]|nr:MAG: adenylate/guanylate cyclase domain-containing protein [Chloroflexota bacterium]
MGVAGVPQPRDDHAAAAARFALGVLGFIEDRRHAGGRCLDFRVGLSSGPMIGGVIGRRKFVFDVWGDAVNTAARMESTGEAGRIQISEPTYRLLRDAFVCEPRGSMEVKGKGQMMTWWLIREGVSQLAHSAD